MKTINVRELRSVMPQLKETLAQEHELLLVSNGEPVARILPVLRKRLDVVGFWVWDGASNAEITGTNPQKSPIGEANVTWIIRWESKAARDAAMKGAFAGDDWAAVWAKHPDPNGYVQMAARFMRPPPSAQARTASHRRDRAAAA